MNTHSDGACNVATDRSYRNGDFDNRDSGARRRRNRTSKGMALMTRYGTWFRMAVLVSTLVGAALLTPRADAAELICVTDPPDCGAHECADQRWSEVGYVEWTSDPDVQQVIWCRPAVLPAIEVGNSENVSNQDMQQ